MALTKSKLCYFVTWTELETYIQEISSDAGHWEKIETSLTVFLRDIYSLVRSQKFGLLCKISARAARTQ